MVDSMSDRETLLRRTEKARAAFQARQDEVDVAKREYHQHVRELVAAGMSLREIATALGLSHQRVHQIVAQEPSTAKRRRSTTTTAAAGTATLLVLLAVLAAVSGIPTPWSPAQASDGATAQARPYPIGLERFDTPQAAAEAAVVSAHPELREVASEVVLRFPDEVALDARVHVTADRFCRIYPATGEQAGTTVTWTAFGEGVSCSPSSSASSVP
jgi:hypothetical protein